MSDETPYIDPNSGAAPQPGGMSTTSLIEDAEQVERVEQPEEVKTEEVKTDGAETQRVGTERIVTEPGTDVGTDVNADLDADPDAGGVEEVEDDGTGEGDQGDSGSAPVGSFDPRQPGKYSVAQVLAYIAANPDAKDAIVEAEKADKGRKTIVES